MKIKDSGTRRDFGTGSVRDAAIGKGRMDLMPMGFLERTMQLKTAIGAAKVINRELADQVNPRWVAFQFLCRFMQGAPEFLPAAGVLLLSIIGHRHRKSGAPFCFSMPDWDGLIEVSKLYEAGCLKYGDRNWEKGQPAHVYVDSAMRHLAKDLRGDTDEDHLVAACWNTLCLCESLGWITDRELPESLLDGLPARARKPLCELMGQTRHAAGPDLPDKAGTDKFSYAP